MKTTRYLARRTAGSLTLALLMTAAAGSAWAGQSLDIPSKTWGISFGNSKSFTGLRFNYIRGAQTGLAVGIVNYAYSVKGLQLGLVNIVRDNPRGLKVLPVFNTSF